MKTERCKHGLIPETCGICTKHPWVGKLHVPGPRGCVDVAAFFQRGAGTWSGEDRTNHKAQSVYRAEE